MSHSRAGQHGRGASDQQRSAALIRGSGWRELARSDQHRPSRVSAPARRPRRGLIVVAVLVAVVAVITAVAVVLTGSGARSLSPAATLADPGFSLRGVAAVTFSPDGQTVATGDSNGSTSLWDVATGRRIATLTDPGSSQGVQSVAFDPRAAMLATGDADAHFYVWDSIGSRMIASLANPMSGQGAGVTGIEFSPDGTTVAAADGVEDSAFLWNVSQRRMIQVLKDPYSTSVGYPGVRGVAFSPDGKTVVTADGEGTSYEWNVATGHLISSLADPRSKGVNSIAFNGDGTTMAAGDDNGSTYLWDVAAGHLIGSLSDPGSKGVNSVALSPNGKTLATGDQNGSTYVWNVSKSVSLQVPTLTLAVTGDESVASVAFSPDGVMLAVGCANDKTYLWRVR